VDTIVEVPAVFKAASLCCALLFDLAESARRAARAGVPWRALLAQRRRSGASSEGGEGLRWRPRVRYGLQASLST